MNRQAKNDSQQLSRSIRREMGSPMTTRFVRSLPFFRANDVLPTHLLDLLARLEDQETMAVPGRNRA